MNMSCCIGRSVPLLCLFFVFCCPLFVGCEQAKKVVHYGTKKVIYKNWHHFKEWDAEDYFTDPQVIALCKAIEADDLEEMQRLIDAGADVNALGTGNMTPLLWAYPDNKKDRFELLLKNGADPDVIVADHFNSGGTIRKGMWVSQLCAGTKFEGYLELVLDHGAKTELPDRDSLLITVIQSGVPDKMERIQLLIDRGADLDHIGTSDRTAAATAVGWGAQYDIL